MAGHWLVVGLVQAIGRVIGRGHWPGPGRWPWPIDLGHGAGLLGLVQVQMGLCLARLGPSSGPILARAHFGPRPKLWSMGQFLLLPIAGLY